MDLYLDTEVNGHGGDLISLAIAGTDGSHWYGVWLKPMDPHPWVAEHVIPYIDTLTPRARGPEHCRFALREYLLSRSGATIWADWPDDFAHLMRIMSGASYPDSFMIPCTMQLIVTPDGEPKPEVPHNALSDALALMRWHQDLCKSTD